LGIVGEEQCLDSPDCKNKGLAANRKIALPHSQEEKVVRGCASMSLSLSVVALICSGQSLLAWL
jgi:hypothetical protein